VTACIGEPISWPRLEGFALGAPDPAIASHVDACPACWQCLDHIRGDAVALPPLALPPTVERARRTRRWWWVAPVFAGAAAAVLLVALWPARPATTAGDLPATTIAVKGVGEVTLELVRERAGAIRYDARGFAPGDRWKVVVTCPPSQAAWIDVSVADGAAPASIDHPLPAVQLPCGNRVVVPGAFTITGSAANRVCASISAAPGAETGTACVTVHPE
jgi:hypothetical protein